MIFFSDDVIFHIPETLRQVGGGGVFISEIITHARLLLVPYEDWLPTARSSRSYVFCVQCEFPHQQEDVS